MSKADVVGIHINTLVRVYSMYRLYVNVVITSSMLNTGILIIIPLCCEGDILIRLCVRDVSNPRPDDAAYC